MKLQSDPHSGANTITGYGDGYVEINRTPYSHAVLLSSDGAIQEWGVQSFDELSAADFSQIASLRFLPMFGNSQANSSVSNDWSTASVYRGDTSNLSFNFDCVPKLHIDCLSR